MVRTFDLTGLSLYSKRRIEISVSFTTWDTGEGRAVLLMGTENWELNRVTV